MRVPVEWIKQHVDFTCSIDELAYTLTMFGLEVEEIDRMSDEELAKNGGAPDGSDSAVFDVYITPNRGDCLSVAGMSREIAAVLDLKRKIFPAGVKAEGPESSSQIKISIQDPDLCFRYAGTVIRNVTIKESPDWMKNRLIKAGMRPISNVVDITNYLMLEYGQPLHAFDLDLLKGPEIIVRRARTGEKMTTIDGVERELDTEILVIADRDRAVAIAGVMGGFDTEVTQKTKNILIESANFNPVSIRKTSRKLGLATESSYRFERSVDPKMTDEIAVRAAELLRELADGEVCAGVVDIYPSVIEPEVLQVEPGRVNGMLGTSLNPDEMARFLQRLEMDVKNEQNLVVTVPTFRADVKREVDVIEEIARVLGYDNIDCTLPRETMQGKDSPAGRFQEKVRHILVSCGSQEVLTHSLVEPRLVNITGRQDAALSVRNVLSEELSRLRVMLLPNLLDTIARNQSFGIRDLSIFEAGKIYHKDGEIGESRSVAMVMVGNQWRSSWNLSTEALNADFYLCKGVVESLLSLLGVSKAEFVPAEDPLLHPTRAAEVKLDGETIGIIGEISPAVIEKMDLRGRPVGFEFNLDKLMSLVPENTLYQQLPKFPALYRHIAVVVKKDQPFAHIESLIHEAGGEVIESVEMLDLYEGQHIGPDEKSITLSITFRSLSRTLTDEEVTGILDDIRGELTKTIGASFRA